MARPVAPPSLAEANRRVTFSAASDFGLIELASGSPLRVQILPSGTVFALRHGTTLINQLLPGPVDDGLFRLLLRWRGDDDQGPHRNGGTGSVPSANVAGESHFKTDDREVVPPRSNHLQRQPTQGAGWTHLVGASVDFKPLSSAAAAWTCTPLPGLHCETQLQLH